MKQGPVIFRSGTVGRGTHAHGATNAVQRPEGTNTWLLEYTVSGSGRARIHAGAKQLTPGTLLIYEAGAPQDYDIDMETGHWDHIWFCFDPRPHWLEWLHWPAIAPRTFLIEAPETPARQQMLAEMERALLLNQSVHVRRRDLVMNILERVLLDCDMWNPVGTMARRDERINTVLETINCHLAEDLSIAGLADVCALSPSRLSHLFREQMGQTPMQYIESRRLEKAGELLLMTRKPIAQIAEETGFNSPFYFSRVFKARTGLAPRQARRQHA